MRLRISFGALIFLSLSSAALAQFEVLQLTDTEIADVHIGIRADNIADIFFVARSPADSVDRVVHAAYSLATHQLIDTPETLLVYGQWSWMIDDVIEDGAGYWYAAVTGHQQRSQWAEVDSNRTFLFYGQNQVLGQSVLHEGVMHYTRQASDDWWAECDLTSRDGGGVALSAVCFGTYIIQPGGASEPDNHLEFWLYNSGSLIPGRQYQFFYYEAPMTYGPDFCRIVSFSPDSLHALISAMTSWNQLAMVTLPDSAQSPVAYSLTCETSLQPIPEFSCTHSGALRLAAVFVNGGELFLVSGVTPDGSCNVLGTYLRAQDVAETTTWHSGFGFASVFTFQGWLMLGRGDTNGVQAQPVGVFYDPDLRQMISSNLTISDGGQVAVLWSEWGNQDSTFCMLKIGSVGWTTPLEVKDPSFIVPHSTFVVSAFPNPFNEATTIRFSLPLSSHVNLEVCDILGRKVMTLMNDLLASSEHSVPFDGSGLAAGLYFARLTTPHQQSTSKLLLLK